MPEKTAQPLDANNNPIPAVALKQGAGVHKISMTGASARNSTPFSDDTKVVYIYATADCFIEFGKADVAATLSHHFIPAGLYLAFAINQNDDKKSTHLAAILSSGTGDLYISEAG